MSTAKKKAAKKTATPKEEAAPQETAEPKEEALYACTVLKDHTKIGAMLCLKGTRAQIPKSKAKELEELKKVRIDGVV